MDNVNRSFVALDAQRRQAGSGFGHCFGMSVIDLTLILEGALHYSLAIPERWVRLCTVNAETVTLEGPTEKGGFVVWECWAFTLAQSRL